MGIIKHRVKKLNELGFEWNPSLMKMGDEDFEEKETGTQSKTRLSNRSSAKRRHSNASEPEEEAERPSKKQRAPPVRLISKEKIFSGSVPGITRSGPGKKWQVRTNCPKTNERIYLGSHHNHEDAIAVLEAYKAKNPSVQRQKPAPSSPKKKSTTKKVQVKAKKTKTGKWKVNFNHNGEQIHVGSFDSHEEATEALKQAKQNLSSKAKQSHSRPVGVTCPKGKRWEVRIKIKGQKDRKYIGSYETEAQAIVALGEAERKYNDSWSLAKSHPSSPSRRESMDSTTSQSESRLKRLRMRAQRGKGEEDSDNENSQDDDTSNRNDIKNRNRSVSTKALDDKKATPIKSNIASSARKKYAKNSVLSKKSQPPGSIRGLRQKKSGKWEARGYINGVRKYIGIFSTRKEGIEALREAGADDFTENETESNEDVSESSKHQSEENDDDTTKTGSNKEEEDDDSNKTENDGDNDTAEIEDESDDDKNKIENDENTTENDTDSITDGGTEEESLRTKYFPLILYQMINDSSESTPEILEWLPCGSAFIVKDYVSNTVYDKNCLLTHLRSIQLTTCSFL